MITIVAKSFVKEDKVEEFKALAKELVEESRNEEGCISYNLNEDINNKNILTFIEVWKDKEAIALHNTSAHYTRIVPKFAKLREKSEVNLYVMV